MKNVYLLIALLTTSAGAFAKGEYQPIVTAGPVVNGKFPHFGNQVVNTTTSGGSAPAKVSLRLIGRTYTKFSAGSFVPIDSYYYRYEDDRGGILANDNIDNDESLLYSESIYFKFDPGLASFTNHLRRTQDYLTGDFKNKVHKLTYQPWKAASGKFEDSGRYVYDYDDDKTAANYGKMIGSAFEQKLGIMWANTITSGIAYAGDLVDSMGSNFYQVNFEYDANSRLIEVVDQERNTTTGVWKNNEKHTYEYLVNNMTKHFLAKWNSVQNAWVYEKNWQYEYDNDNVLIASIEQKWDNGGWVNLVRHEYTYDGKQNMTTDLKKVWNGSAFVDASKEVWSYNIQNLPDLITTSSWVAGAWEYTADDKQYRLYYENYFPAEIEKIAGGKELSVYPVPAADVVNVNMTLNSPEDISVAMYDVKGSTVYRSVHKAVSELQAAIPVSNLPAGTYFLRVVGNSTNVARSIVVQH